MTIREGEVSNEYIRRMERVMSLHELDHLSDGCRLPPSAIIASVQLDNNWLQVVPSVFVSNVKKFGLV